MLPSKEEEGVGVSFLELMEIKNLADERGKVHPALMARMSSLSQDVSGFIAHSGVPTVYDGAEQLVA